MKQSFSLLPQTLVNRSKKVALSLVLLMTLTATYSFAAAPADSTNNGNGLVTSSFQKDFKNATILESETHRRFTKLTFKMNDIILFAYYSENGDLLAVTRNILSSQLPVALMIDLRKNYSGYWITELFELNGEDQNVYYVSLEDADSKVVLRSTGNDIWEFYQKTTK